MTQYEWIMDLFPHGGFYIDAGAHDGIGDSNTYTLEQSGKWEGLCIEPSSYFNGIHKNRKCFVSSAVLGEFDNEETLVEFTEVKGGELSGVTNNFCDHWNREEVGIVSKTMRCTVSLDTLLDFFNAPKVIEYLDIDIEGSEFDVLRGLSGRYIIHAICVEHNGVVVNQERIFNLLSSRNYNREFQSEVEDWYLLQE